MEMFVVGQKAHMQLCYDFVQFETYGVMEFDQACKYCESAHLEIKEIRVIPLANTLTVIELTASGIKLSKNLHTLWEKVYVPGITAAEPNWVLEDLYTAREADQMNLAVNKERFDVEMREGRLSGIIAKCPAIALFDP